MEVGKDEGCVNLHTGRCRNKRVLIFASRSDHRSHLPSGLRRATPALTMHCASWGNSSAPLQANASDSRSQGATCV